MVRFLLLALVFSSHLFAKGELRISCGSNGIELQVCKEGIEAWSKKTGIRVETVSTPNDSNDRLALYQQLLGAHSTDVDLYQIDVVWPGLLANHFVDLNAYLSSDEKKAHLASTITNSTVKGKLVALPWFTDGGVLYYRKDLLTQYKQQPPKTWADLEKTAKIIQEDKRKNGKADFWGYVFQARAYEGLTCNALEWISSHGAGQIVEEDGRVSINNPKAVAALKQVAGWINSISPQGVLSYSEEETRGVFQSGNAVFMRNWPYAWALLNGTDSPIKGKVGMAALPSSGTGTKGASTLGGWALSVSAYSPMKEKAIELAKFLTGFEEQKRRALVASFNPTQNKLYEDKEVLLKNPHLKELKSVFQVAVPRPSRQTGNRYNRVSAEFWDAVHAVLGKRMTPEESLKSLEQKLVSLSNGGNW